MYKYSRTKIFLNIILNLWIYPVFIKGMRNNRLDFDDMYRCSQYDTSHITGQNMIQVQYCKAWQECVVRMIQSLLLGYVIDYFGGGDLIKYDHACVAAGGVCLCAILNTVLFNNSRVRLAQLGMRARSACCTLLYKKSLKLNQLSMGKTTVGQIINLMSNDVYRFDMFTMVVNYLIIAPIQSAIVIYIMYTYMGWASFVSVALLVLLIVFQFCMGKMFSKVRLMTAKLTDTRLQHMVEVISGMGIVKMYSWEQSFADLVAEARKQEVSCIQRSCFLKTVNISLYTLVSKLMLFFCFITLVLTGGVLYAKAVFVSMLLVNCIKENMTEYFPELITLGAELLVSCNRIEVIVTMKFLQLGETQIKSIQNPNNLSERKANGKQSPEVSINNITAKWSDESTYLTLENISTHLRAGDLLAVIGPVGAGKSSLLMTILNELPVLSGSIETVGSMSYASQEAWSFNTSVRNNILFGAEYHESRYKRVVEVCALVRDFERFPFGDKSLVGERGVQLSGGQNARITLARALCVMCRALYRNSDIVLMDDPLSAVDPSVAEHIFDKCIVDYLCDKIRILVTHQIQFIRKATQILVLNDEGKCLGLGSYDELQSRGLDFMSIISDQEREVDDKAKQHMDDNFDSRINAQGTLVAENLTPNNDENVIEPKITDEGRETGSISGNVYCTFIKAGAGLMLFSTTILSTIIAQTIVHGSDYFLAKWYIIHKSLTMTDKNQNTDNINSSEQNRDVIIYSSLMAALFIASLLRAITWFVMFMRASVNLHNTIFYRLLRAPISVFDSNPVGRILNRFSKDLGTIDEQLPSTAFDLNVCMTQGIGGIIMITIVNPYLIIPAFFLIVMLVAARAIYIKSARDIRRTEGLTRSPVFSHVSTTFNGLASVRAFGAQEMFEKQFYVYQDDHSATWMLVTTACYAFAIIIDGLCFLYIIIIFVVIMLFPGQLEAGEAGLALSSGLYYIILY
ncbi:unnamed protein product [Medioppia subpectinata]|uniref:Uncharacterized protein n=1 Tax=Medioppia subpectinata TaxID=1979941 RepID=A0A7R9KDH3_9ACAR|nr:unnamed protein product [Medioppia subpectinata]CAG2101428.1 unnamed protein product [Medioppia subpectinata]